MPSFPEKDTEQDAQDGPFGKILSAGLDAKYPARQAVHHEQKKSAKDKERK
jgi:hypothetical protein